MDFSEADSAGDGLNDNADPDPLNPDPAAIPPAVLSVSPVQGAFQVPRSAKIQAFFSKAMDAATVPANFQVYDTTTPLFPDPLPTARRIVWLPLPPTLPLSLGANIQPTLTTGLKDTYGISLQSQPSPALP